MSRRSPLRRAAFLGAATVAATVAAVALTGGGPAQAAAANLSATFAQTSVWTGGYGGEYTIANRGDAASTGWTVEFDLPAGSSVSSSWSSVKTQSGQHYKFTNAGFNGTVKPGATASFGFNVAERLRARRVHDQRRVVRRMAARSRPRRRPRRQAPPRHRRPRRPLRRRAVTP